jgi:MFS family permease
VSGQEQARPPLLPISALGLLTIVAYGACYYAYGVLIEPIRADTHWPDAALGVIFSAILVITGVLGVLVGRALDRQGPRPLFLFAAVAGTGAMLAASAQSALLPFAIAYAGGCGLVGALGFYHITQTAVARAAPAAAARAIIWLTIFVSGTLALALLFSLLAGASVGAVYTLQGVYAYELIDPRHLGMVLGIQQAVFAVGGAIGPVAAGALLGATGSYTPAITIITAGFAGAAGVLLLGQTRDPAPAHSPHSLGR